MPAFLKIGDIEGEAQDQDHKGWVLIDSLSYPIQRSIPQGAKDQQRTKGDTTLGDVVISRQMDKSSTKLAEACANGTFFTKVEAHLCATVGKKQEPYLKYELQNVIISSYSFSGNSSGDPLPSESIQLAYTAVEWTYIVLDPNDGSNKGNVPGKYTPNTGKSS